MYQKILAITAISITLITTIYAKDLTTDELLKQTQKNLKTITTKDKKVIYLSKVVL